MGIKDQNNKQSQPNYLCFNLDELLAWSQFDGRVVNDSSIVYRLNKFVAHISI